jgi:uncharacterized membrane protein YgcG
MESHPSVTDHPMHIPPMIWFLGAALIVGLIAVLVFNVAVGTVTYYGFIALFVGSHFFMHGGHGGHGGSGGHQHGGPVSSAAESDKSDPSQRSSHTGGCH